jgi:HD-GYP domain-containing protein (c-di-GMP phosphodiesterase class II)
VTESSIFEQSTNDVQNQDSPPQFTIPTEIVELVGSGKKYQTVEDALKSVPHAQKHIQTLESELAELKEELTKRKTTQELLDEIKSGVLPEQTTQAVEFDQDRLTQIVEQTLTNKEKQLRAQSNAKSVADKFTEQFGEKAQEVYATIAKESGLSVQDLNKLAATSPNAVLKLAGLFKGVTTSKSTGTVNTESLNANRSPETLSARVPKGATTKDLVNAWKIAGEKVKQNSTN